MASKNKRRRSDVTTQNSMPVRNRENLSDDDLLNSAIHQLAILKKDGGSRNIQAMAVIETAVSKDTCQNPDSLINNLKQKSDGQPSVELNRETNAFQDIGRGDSWHCFLEVPLASPAIRLTSTEDDTAVCLLDTTVNSMAPPRENPECTASRISEVSQESEIGIRENLAASQKDRGTAQERGEILREDVLSQTQDDGTCMPQIYEAHGSIRTMASNPNSGPVSPGNSTRKESTDCTETVLSARHAQCSGGESNFVKPDGIPSLADGCSRQCKNVCAGNNKEGGLQSTDPDMERRGCTEDERFDRRGVANQSDRKGYSSQQENGHDIGACVTNIPTQPEVDAGTDGTDCPSKFMASSVCDIRSAVGSVAGSAVGSAVGSASKMVPIAGAEVVTWAGLAAALGASPHQWPFQPQKQPVTDATPSVPPKLLVPSQPPLAAGTFPSYPPAAAFLSPKCALWDCLRPAQGDYCSELHSAMAATEGGNGRAPVVRPWGIELKDPLLFAALRARIAGKAVGIPDCEKAVTSKSPWGAPELFDCNMLVGESLREWLFFDKSQPAYGTGTRKQRALPDYSGRWHDSYKQHFKDHKGLKRILYLDPQPTGNVEWHLYEYELKGSSEWALYRLEMKKRDPTKAVNSVLIQSSQRGHKSAFTAVKPNRS